MAKHSSGRATTPPKGRPTRSRDQTASAWSDRWVTIQWVGVGLAILAVLLLAFVLSDPGNPLHGS